MTGGEGWTVDSIKAIRFIKDCGGEVVRKYWASIAELIDLIISCLFAGSFYEIILHFPSVSMAGAVFCSSLSSQRDFIGDSIG